MMLLCASQLTSQNVWTSKLIDHMNFLITRHHSITSDFRVAGRILEESTKLYSMRVNSLAMSVQQMTSGMSKSVTPESLETPNLLKKIKTRTKERHYATVTKYPESLNKFLDTNANVDPFFAKVNSSVGDTCRPNQLLTNLLRSKNFNVSFPQANSFWDSTERPNILSRPSTSSNTINIPFPEKASQQYNRIRYQLSNFRISLEPCERGTAIIDVIDSDDEGLGQTPNETFTEHFIASQISDSGYYTQLQLTNDDSTFEYSQKEAVNDHENIRNPDETEIDDAMPETDEVFEYSFRTQNFFRNFWSCPSHWKYLSMHRKTIKRNKSKARSKKLKCNGIAIEDVIFHDVRKEKLKPPRRANVKRWKRSFTTLPKDFNIQSDVLESLFSRNITLQDPINNALNCFIENDNSVVDNFSQETAYVSQESNLSSHLVQPMHLDNLALSGRQSKATISHASISQCSKSLDMKKLKELSLAVVKAECAAKENHTEVEFSMIMQKLPKLFETGCEHVSCALIFYSLLQNAQKLRFSQPSGMVHDFFIVPKDEV